MSDIKMITLSFLIYFLFLFVFTIDFFKQRL